MRWVSCIAFVAVLAPGSAAAELSFNKDVRPILSDRCFACHGPDKNNRKSKLRLDQEEGAKGDLGKGRFGLVPGHPEQSEAFKRITSDSKTLRMPPAYMGHDKLSDHDIQVLKTWIEQGAKYEKHWAFVPPVKAAAPDVKDAAWVKNPIDQFILARLERDGIHTSPEADRATLIRRVSFDITGLPATTAEVDAFIHDDSPQAYEKVVDRLLASPRYAERMAIRWLEAARYADTNGYQSDGPRDMWRWRDWVLDAFQKNMPYNQFVLEQIGGDLLPNATLSQKIATAFQRNHRTSAEGGIVDEEFRVDYVADRTETTSTVFLGLTLGCARCHDHKFDPMTQRDYYSMFAFYNNVPEKGFVWNFGNEEPTIKAPLPEQETKLAQLDEAMKTAGQHVKGLEPASAAAQEKWEKEIAGHKKTVAWAPLDGLILSSELAADEQHFDGKRTVDAGKAQPTISYRDPFTLAARVKPETLKGAILSKGEDYFEGQQHALYLIDGKVRLHVTYRWTDLAMRMETVKPVKQGEWQHIVATYDGSMKAAGVRIYVNGELQELKILFDQFVWPMDSKEPWRIGAGGGLRFQGDIKDVRVYGRALSADEVAALNLTEPLNTLAAKSNRSAAETAKLHLAFLDKYAPKNVAQARARLAIATSQRNTFYDSIPTVMVMKERTERRPTFVLKRGAYDAPGDPVTPNIPSFLPPMKPDWPKNRLGLAMWLADRGNPLTARAAVNRYWASLFGVGLVKTVEDFGSQGEWPIHQELLDWLAVEFMDSGWDVKHIMKTMVMSAAYRQASTAGPEMLQRDPENRLLARGPRYRLPAEMIRDQALAVSGLLANKMGGPSVKPYQPDGLWQELQGGTGYKADTGDSLYRRSLYTYWRRTIAPPNMINFDSPTHEVCIVRENRTNTPLQALNLMNDTLFLEAARKLGERMLTEGGQDRLAYGFHTVLGRDPKARERSALEKALEKFETYYKAHPKDAQEYLRQGESPIPKKIAAPELASYAALGGIILNLDETVTKE
ncbi:MAG: DUF1553 domain-containing protein [Bryobacteraceae bacterium]